MGLFSKPEVVIAKESSNAKEYLRQLEELAEKATGENAKKIVKEIAVVKAGIIGEDNILFELKNSVLYLNPQASITRKASLSCGKVAHRKRALSFAASSDTGRAQISSMLIVG